MRTIEIKTTQNVTIEYELAILRDRVLAFFIDLIIMIVIYMIGFLLLIVSFGQALTDSDIGMGMMASILPIFGFVFYHFISEVLANGQTWGKKSLGIRVVRLDGKEPNVTDYLLRAIFYILDAILSLGVLAALLISSSARNQRLGDIAANTTVIKTRSSQYFQLSDILNIDTLEQYEPQFPQVRLLNEKDMLLAKNVISRYRSFGNDAHTHAVHELADKFAALLGITDVPKDKVTFLKTLIKDYIVLTR